MGDPPADVHVGVDFKIDPYLIPSTDIRKLEATYRGGGLSDVWKCSMRTRSGIRTVAVKCLRVTNADDDEAVYKIGRRIRREAYVWMTVLHDRILPLWGITIRDDFGRLPALVSPWMENRSLNDYLKLEFPKLSDHRTSELIQQVATGLCYLHEEKNIVHGDLTGTNVLVDDSGNLRFADFGLSMLLAEAENVTFNSVHPGNTRWMAPEFFMLGPEDNEEELQPQKPTKAGDIYSFGCVMLQVLSGEEPYVKIKDARLVASAISRGRAPFNIAQINMNGSQRQLSSQCLSKEPKRRPSIVQITTDLGM